MKALVYTGTPQPEVQTKPIPTLEKPDDAIIQMVHGTICGSDLHVLQGDVPSVSPGRTLGHEGVGRIVELGPAIPRNRLSIGDMVLVACITSCGACALCQRGMRSHCLTGGWQLGHLVDGTQAEYVRVPHAAGSLYVLPAGVDPRAAVTLSDALPTAMECGALGTRVTPGSTVVIVGAGPVGLAALLTMSLYSPSRVVVLSRNETRLEHARRLGADETINTATAPERVEALAAGPGFDAVVEAVGVPETFALCQRLVAPGGSIANVGVHGRPVSLELDKLWGRNISITSQLVDTVTIPTLLRLWKSRRLDPALLLTHDFHFNDILEAYEQFRNSSRLRMLKLSLSFLEPNKVGSSELEENEKVHKSKL
ncbi:hypothetical protein ASPZODRAFT_98703 [Penicilliopsis zonata CBS 506.65]|uniref:Enoyl reductase (ER) domain-containing protein n=1 Tax=Penicilliopsis zonata CBS 506.65 TaxID=1073090 RepID=A0A1L9SEW1_9EURO|nr:hypothetical protein ASPZODRAFT_98703 [Penicilliopsis zonata CBS 506.65]OJJ45795.1 hypothetical protein ASPZODRAFT_98703 [Penicilliopsis zonata CBS 506.65]